MTCKVRYTNGARNDLSRHLLVIAKRDPASARKARAAINDAVRLLEQSPFSCRTAGNGDPFLRELIVPFGHSGFVLLSRIESDNIVSVLAARHQLEDDYY